MNIIVNADRNWGIGRDGRLLVSIPADMRFFKEKTVGNAIIVGRRTLGTFPGGRPLKGRENVVLSRRPGLRVKGATVASSVEEAMAAVAGYPSERVFVVGGESVYRQMLPFCDVAYVTKVDYAYEADAHFPDLDADPAWRLLRQSEEQTCHDMEYRFCAYVRDLGRDFGRNWKAKEG